jgi:hypothetical protein
MSLRTIAAIFVAAILVIGFIAWNRYSAKEPPAGQAQQQMPPAPGGGEASGGGDMSGGMVPSAPAGDPGVTWDTPKRWVSELASGMRLATYVVPGDKTGDDAQCAVYYFGPGQGGGVDPNIERWISEFSTTSKPERKIEQMNGMSIARVKVAGTYLAHGGPMQGGEPSQQPGWELLGAIVTAPQGSVFFKLTGPEKTVSRAVSEFDGMLKSLRSK